MAGDSLNKQGQRRRTPGAEDIDEIVVERLINGVRCRASANERDRAIDILDDKGWAAHTIALRIHCADRTVVRRRVARRQAEAEKHGLILQTLADAEAGQPEQESLS